MTCSPMTQLLRGEFGRAILGAYSLIQLKSIPIPPNIVLERGDKSHDRLRSKLVAGVRY